jgi:hypothetical protein
MLLVEQCYIAQFVSALHDEKERNVQKTAIGFQSFEKLILTNYYLCR